MIPKPKRNETKVKFYARCIPFVIKEGTAKNLKQAVSICAMLHEKKNK
jgi:hypothetical protein